MIREIMLNPILIIAVLGVLQFSVGTAGALLAAVVATILWFWMCRDGLPPDD
jgi:hypothetical protein